MIVDAGAAAASHMLAAGLVPLLRRDVLQALWRRGGDDSLFAAGLYELTDGYAA